MILSRKVFLLADLAVKLIDLSLLVLDEAGHLREVVFISDEFDIVKIVAGSSQIILCFQVSHSQVHDLVKQDVSYGFNISWLSMGTRILRGVISLLKVFIDEPHIPTLAVAENFAVFGDFAELDLHSMIWLF